ncbi:hypothetical protein EV363DRAFT_1405164 [Boletus edulis]|nr:hypothetical protein EV363DRAFT_1405164 [Boletus edulis]
MLCPVLQPLFAAPSTLTCVIAVLHAHARVRVPLRVTPAHVPFLLFPDARLPECQKHVESPHPARLYESTQ